VIRQLEELHAAGLAQDVKVALEQSGSYLDSQPLGVYVPGKQRDVTSRLGETYAQPMMKSNSILASASIIVTPLLASALLLVGCAKVSVHCARRSSGRGERKHNVI